LRLRACRKDRIGSAYLLKLSTFHESAIGA
jgi:hypothetical protein